VFNGIFATSPLSANTPGNTLEVEANEPVVSPSSTGTGFGIFNANTAGTAITSSQFSLQATGTTNGGYERCIQGTCGGGTTSTFSGS
jgi:hypothetical protein